MSQSLLKNC